MRTLSFVLKDVNNPNFCEDSSSCFCFHARTHKPSRCPGPETYLGARELAGKIKYQGREAVIWPFKLEILYRGPLSLFHYLYDISWLKKNCFHILLLLESILYTTFISPEYVNTQHALPIMIYHGIFTLCSSEFRFLSGILHRSHFP